MMRPSAEVDDSCRVAVRRSKPGVDPGLHGDLADRAVQALTAEALLTPKPALVDGRGPGAHRDMNLDCLLRSARTLQPAFLEMARTAWRRSPSQQLREELAQIGRRAETDMLVASGGVNTHRGAIWTLGLLVAASSMSTRGTDDECVGTVAGHIARFTDRGAPVQNTHGGCVQARYGALGARGEAQAGFPHVMQIGLPTLQAARARGLDETHARLDALMAIMSSLTDTCLLYRGGPPAIWAAQQGARRVLQAGGTSSTRGYLELLQLDAQLMSLRASPGGSADLLAASLFVDATHTDTKQSIHET